MRLPDPIRIDRQSLTEHGDRIFLIARLEVDHPAVIHHGGVARFLLEDLQKLGDGLRKAPL